MRQTIEIPPAGQIKVVRLTGQSIIVESASVYETEDDVPTLAFRPGNNLFPIYPRSQYFNSDPEKCNQFDSVVIEGTAASAGDEITLLAVDEKLETEINIVFIDSYKTFAGTTKAVTVESTVAFTFPVNEYTDAATGKLAKAVTIQALGNNMKYAFNTNPVTGAGSLGHLLAADSEPIRIEGIDFIQNFAAIAETASPGGNVELQYTMEF